MKRMEENRLLVTSCEAVCASLRHHIAYLEQQVEDTRKQLKDHIQAHPTLREQQRLLCSIPGIAHATAALLLAELGSSELGSLSRSRMSAKSPLSRALPPVCASRVPACEENHVSPRLDRRA